MARLKRVPLSRLWGFVRSIFPWSRKDVRGWAPLALQRTDPSLRPSGRRCSVLAKPRLHPGVRPVLVLLPLLLLSGCAKVADPIPPVNRVPKSVADLSLVQTGKTVRLSFSIAEPDVTAVEIYRQCQTTGELGARGQEAYRRLQLTELKPAGQASSYAIDDTLDQLECRYALRLVNETGRVSDLSNPVRTSDRPPPAPPANLRAAVGKDSITLSWEPPSQDMTGSPSPTVVGYLVNGQTRVTEPRFEDREVRFGQPKTYTVQAIGQADAPLAFSEAASVQVTPLDQFGPAAPPNPVALSSGGKVQLAWEPSPDADTKGYLVYRGATRDQLSKVSEIVTTNSFNDPVLQIGTVLFYQVAAVDQAGNEGPRSELVEVTVNP